MTVRELMDLLRFYPDDDEIEIDIYETQSGKHIDTTADITIVDEDRFIPVLRIDVEAGKFKKLL